MSIGPSGVWDHPIIALWMPQPSKPGRGPDRPESIQVAVNGAESKGLMMSESVVGECHWSAEADARPGSKPESAASLAVLATGTVAANSAEQHTMIQKLNTCTRSASVRRHGEHRDRDRASASDDLRQTRIGIARNFAD